MKVTSIRCLCVAVALIAVPAASPVVSGQANFDKR